MTKRITITVPDELHDQLQPFKDQINVSGVCQKALETAVATTKAKGDLEFLKEIYGFNKLLREVIRFFASKADLVDFSEAEIEDGEIVICSWNPYKKVFVPSKDAASTKKFDAQTVLSDTHMKLRLNKGRYVEVMFYDDDAILSSSDDFSDPVSDEDETLIAEMYWHDMNRLLEKAEIRGVTLKHLDEHEYFGFKVLVPLASLI